MTVSPAIAGSDPVAPELWTLAEQAVESEAFGCVAQDVARLEALLLWAGNEALTCSPSDPRPLLERARAMGERVRAGIAACRVPPPAVPVESTPDAPVVLLVPNVVHFAFDRSDLDGVSRSVLDSLRTVLNAHPELTIAVRGHTDTRGSDAYNVALGERRANAVMNYLASTGVTQDRMRRVSRGEAELWTPATTELEHARNRRVEIVFLNEAGAVVETRRQERDLKPRTSGPSESR